MKTLFKPRQIFITIIFLVCVGQIKFVTTLPFGDPFFNKYII